MADQPAAFDTVADGFHTQSPGDPPHLNDRDVQTMLSHCEAPLQQQQTMQRQPMQDQGDETDVSNAAMSTVSNGCETAQKHVTFSDDVQSVHVGSSISSISSRPLPQPSHVFEQSSRSLQHSSTASASSTTSNYLLTASTLGTQDPSVPFALPAAHQAGDAETRDAPSRGASEAAGIHVHVWKGGLLAISRRNQLRCTLPAPVGRLQL